MLHVVGYLRSCSAILGSVKSSTEPVLEMYISQAETWRGYVKYDEKSIKKGPNEHFTNHAMKLMNESETNNLGSQSWVLNEPKSFLYYC